MDDGTGASDACISGARDAAGIAALETGEPLLALAPFPVQPHPKMLRAYVITEPEPPPGPFRQGDSFPS